MRPRIRHWQEHYDPKADLVFTRRLRMGDDSEKPFVMPGEKVTPEMRESLGAARLRRWYDSGILNLADFKPREAQRETALAAKTKREQS